MTALKTYNSSRTGIGHFFVANPTSFLHNTFHKFNTFSPFFSSWVKLIFPTNKQFTLITTVPSVLDFEFLFGSVLFAGPESRTQYHFLHLTPLSLLRFSSSKSSFTFDFPFKKFTIYLAPSSVRLFPTSHPLLSTTRQIQNPHRTRRFSQRQQHSEHSLLHDIVLYRSFSPRKATRHEKFLQLRQRFLLQHRA